MRSGGGTFQRPVQGLVATGPWHAQVHLTYFTEPSQKDLLCFADKGESNW